MNVQFHIHYFTHPGQVVMISGNTPELGDFDEKRALEMTPLNDGHWELILNLNVETDMLQYRYFIRKEGVTERREFGQPHRICTKCNLKDCALVDCWQEEPRMGFLYTSAYTESLLAVKQEPEHIQYEPGHIIIKVHAPFVRKNQCVGISGDNALFGAWKAEKALRMYPEQFPVWAVSIDANILPLSSCYKFVLMDKETGNVLHYEWGEPRLLTVSQHMLHQMVVYSGLSFRFQEAPWKGAGVSIPVFSLRSENSWGCGDFGDLRRMVDWAVETGLQLIQTLPVNDTSLTGTWVDSYPYSAISCFALHPIYCNIQNLPTLHNQELRNAFESKRKELNQLPDVDYERVIGLKWEFFKAIFEQEGHATLNSEEYLTFFERNKKWLVPYAAFCYLIARTGHYDFRDWGLWSEYHPAQIADLTDPVQKWYSEIAIHYFVQFHLDRQLKQARDYAHVHSVVLKGDIPIGVSRNSVEAWSESHLFNMDVQVGAPPDNFSDTGQNWGFPSYRWEAMHAEHYDWWKRRFTKMADYFDAYRIDHILGFFRIWEIPTHAVNGLLGHFNPALPLQPEDMNGYGFNFDEESMTTPYLTDNLLIFLFGKMAPQIIKNYLKKKKDGFYELKKEFRTQKQIKDSFGEGEPDPETRQLREKLYSLCSEVLFVKDPNHKNGYHPRISAFSTEHFRWLPDAQKKAFSQLYNDFYYVRNIDLWKQKALEKLKPIVDATRMLACGEDLGMIPSCVPEVMWQLGILSLEIQRMPKTPGVFFENLNTLPYESVSTTSTHDMAPLRAWWLENRESTQQYYNQILWRQGDAPWECTPEIATLIIRNHFFAPSIWVVLPWQDLMGIDQKLRNPDPMSERINIPSNPHNYWRYRMHLTLESLLKAKVFNARIKEMVVQSGRL
jgi:4-alpha-glucanotransferase